LSCPTEPVVAGVLAAYIGFMSTKIAVLDLEGGNCAACTYTIEHLGRKVQGVSDVRVDAGSGEIQVQYEGNPGSLEQIAQIVKRLGYEARVRWDSVESVFRSDNGG
jgi:copper chaperone CopZ